MGGRDRSEMNVRHLKVFAERLKQFLARVREFLVVFDIGIAQLSIKS